jgi:4-diphosphocytidyl-2-C-methyl-D-erythritol kinase
VREVVRDARAKVNLFLRVIGLRPDGYHELESLIVPLSLTDTITCRPAQRLALSVEGGDRSLTKGPDNLAIVAALALAEATGSFRGADITLAKRIPVAAGLGGGSADAAAVLSALNELWELELPEGELLSIAADVGSDVPATLAARPVVVRGRGERLETVSVPPMWWAIVPAGFHVRTPDAFRWWDEDGGTTGPDPGELVGKLAAGELRDAAWQMYNDLQVPVFLRHPELLATAESLATRGALSVMMCGSGPTLAGLFPDEQAAVEAASAIPGALSASTG